MADGYLGRLAAAREEAYATPIGQIDVSLGERFRDDTIWPFFERLRHEAPVHYTAESRFGPYWSVTRYHDIMAVDTNPAVFSSEGGVAISDQDEGFELENFICMDPPRHDAQRKVISPALAPSRLETMEPIIRERAVRILDALPIGETFDWVDRVSIELTTQMLATLFDFPFEERRKLTRWSDVATASPESGIVESEEQRRADQILVVEQADRGKGRLEGTGGAQRPFTGGCDFWVDVAPERVSDDPHAKSAPALLGKRALQECGGEHSRVPAIAGESVASTVSASATAPLASAPGGITVQWYEARSPFNEQDAPP